MPSMLVQVFAGRARPKASALSRVVEMKWLCWNVENTLPIVQDSLLSRAVDKKGAHLMLIEYTVGQ